MKDPGQRVDELTAGALAFSAEDLDRIIDAAGGLPRKAIYHRRQWEYGRGWIGKMATRRNALLDRLNCAAYGWAIDVRVARKPAPSNQENAFKVRSGRAPTICSHALAQPMTILYPD